MRIETLIVGASCAILAIAPSCRDVRSPSGKNERALSGADASASCRQFAQAFYDWYVPFTRQGIEGPAWNFALQRKADVLDPNMFKALKADSDAQAQAKGEIVGIDFDPFVGSQDPADYYEVRGVKLNLDRCSAEVWPASPTDTAEQTGNPDVIAELAKQNGRWRFVNFRYPDLKADLLNVLARPRTDP